MTGENMQDRSRAPGNHALQKEIGKILSAAAAENSTANPDYAASETFSPSSYALWRGAGLISALASAWPSGLPPPLQSLMFVTACFCSLVALIQYLRLPDRGRYLTRKSAKLHRIV